MEKKKKLDVSNIDLVSFEGFYQTIWDSSFEVSDYEYRNEVVEDEDFTFNEDSYQKAVCEAYTKQWERWLQQYVCKDIKLSFVGVQHPLAYNFSTDTIEAKIGLSGAAKNAIIAKVKYHREEIAGWIKENHSSCDGFWSFLSNDIKDWTRAALFKHTSDRQEAYLAYMLYYIVKAEIGAKNGDDRLEMMAYYNISEQMSISEFITYPGNNKAA